MAEEDACSSSIDCCCECDSDSCCEEEDSVNCDTSWSYHYYYQGMIWHWAKLGEFMTKFYNHQQYYQYNRLSKHNVECYENNDQRENICERESSVDCAECRSCQYQNTRWKREEMNARTDNLQDSLKRSWKDRSPGNINQSKDFHNEGRTAKRVKRPRKAHDNFNRSPNNLYDDLRTEDDHSRESDHDAILRRKDDEDFEMELNEEFKKFLEISQKHRRERGEFIIANHCCRLMVCFEKDPL